MRRRTTPRCWPRSRTQAWDGDWYLRAYDAAGKPVGSQELRGRQDLHREPGLVRARRRRARTTAARGRRWRASTSSSYTENGIVLQQPAYSTYHLELGEVTSYPPGYKENAGIFCHNNTWIHLALVPARRGRPGPRVLPVDLPVGEGGADRDLPQRAVRLRPDDRRPRRGHSGRGEELLAHRHRRLDLRGDLAGHPRRQARLRRAADRSLHPVRLAVVPRHAPLPRRRLRHLRREPGRGVQRRPLAARRRKGSRREPRPARARRRAGRGRGRARLY